MYERVDVVVDGNLYFIFYYSFFFALSNAIWYFRKDVTLSIKYFKFILPNTQHPVCIRSKDFNTVFIVYFSYFFFFHDGVAPKCSIFRYLSDSPDQNIQSFLFTAYFNRFELSLHWINAWNWYFVHIRFDF